MVLHLAERLKKGKNFCPKEKALETKKTVIARITSNIFLMK